MDTMTLLYGCAYYLEYMPYDRMREDMKMMHDAGMNVIRIGESTWSVWEPSDGVFDFTLLDQMLNIAEEFNMKVIVGTPSYAVPSWLVKKDNDILAETTHGKNLYGGRQLFDLTNKTLRFHIERVIRKMLEKCRTHSCIIGYQIDNETKYYDASGSSIQNKFKEYLQNKFKTPDTLNHAFVLPYWSNSINSWDDLPDMRGCINAGLAGEYDAFRRSIVTEYLLWQRKIIDEYRYPDQFVTHNLDYAWFKFGADAAPDGHSDGIQPDADHDKIGDALTIAGTDIYHMTQKDLDGLQISYGGDEMRNICPDNDNYLVLETEAQGFREWVPYPGQLRLQAYAHLASGAKMVEYWHWHSIHNGCETYWKGILSHDLKPNATYREASIVGNEWKKLGAGKLVIKKHAKAAIIVDNRSLTGLKWFPVDKDLSYNSIVKWLYKALYEMNVECDILFEDQVLGKSLMPDGKEPVKKKSRLSGYSLILIPALYSVSEEFVEILRDWTRQGGILVATFKSFFANRELTVWNDAQPHNMTDLFGITYQQFINPERLTIRGNKVKYWAELLMPAKGKNDDAPLTMSEKYEHPYWNKYLGITRHNFGKGTAYYMGCYTEEPHLKKVLENALNDAKIKRYGINEPLSFPLIIKSGINSEGSIIHYVMHFSEELTSIINPFGNVTDLITGKEYSNTEEIALSDWDVKILVENK